MTLRQTANGKNETFADCFQLSGRTESFVIFCVIYIQEERINVMLKLSNDI